MIAPYPSPGFHQECSMTLSRIYRTSRNGRWRHRACFPRNEPSRRCDPDVGAGALPFRAGNGGRCCRGFPMQATSMTRKPGALVRRGGSSSPRPPLRPGFRKRKRLVSQDQRVLFRSGSMHAQQPHTRGRLGGWTDLHANGRTISSPPMTLPRSPPFADSLGVRLNGMVGRWRIVEDRTEIIDLEPVASVSIDPAVHHVLSHPQSII